MLTVTNTTSADATAIPADLLDGMAGRFRGGGLCLVVLQPDGAVAWHDGGAAAFFRQYAVPVLAADAVVTAEFRRGVAGFMAGHGSGGAATASAVGTWAAAGLVVAGFRHATGRRAGTGTVLALVGRADPFGGEDVARACDRVSVDAAAVAAMAAATPGYSADGVGRQARLLLSAVRDGARVAGLEHEVASLSTQLAHSYEELNLIYQISGGVRVNRRQADFFRQACQDARAVLGVGCMGVAVRSDGRVGLAPVVYGDTRLTADDVRQLAGQLVDRVADTKAVVLVNDVAAAGPLRWVAGRATRVLAVPMQRGEQVLGCLFAVDKADGEFDSVDSKLLGSIANEAAVFLENAGLFDDVNGLVMGLMHSLTSAIDAKDPYTSGHSERVAELARMLARRAGLDDPAAERIYMAGLLHDVGKIGVPEAVLQKPGRLTADEFEQMKRHPAIGARILQDVRQVSDLIPGVLHHHERYDGRGYPDGLAGRDIPLMGRILCLADCFDAMTSTRTYRKALPLEVTLADLRRCSGTQFDPALTEAFLSLPAETLRDVLRQQEARPRHEVVVPLLKAA